MAQYTVFYKNDSTKEIMGNYNGVCNDSDHIAYMTGQGCTSMLIESEDTPSNNHYVNDGEDGVTAKHTMSITVDKTTGSVDDVFTFSGVPENATINIGRGTITSTMNSDSSLTLTIKQGGVWRVTFTHPTARKYYTTIFELVVRGATI